MNVIERHNKKLLDLRLGCHAVREGCNSRYFIYKCVKGHEFEADRYRVLKGKSLCPICTWKPGKPMPHEVYEQRLLELESDVYPLERISNMSTPVLHECAEGHHVSITPSKVLKDGQCPRCFGWYRRTAEEYCEDLAAMGIRYTLVGEFRKVMDKTEHQCPDCKHIWLVRPHDIMNGNGCPACATSGLRRNQRAWLYYLRLTKGPRTVYKIGVTTKSVAARMRGFKGTYKVLMEQEFDTAFEAEAAERLILEQFKHAKAYAPDFLPNGGYSELFEFDVLNKDMENFS